MTLDIVKPMHKRDYVHAKEGNTEQCFETWAWLTETTALCNMCHQHWDKNAKMLILVMLKNFAVMIPRNCAQK